MKLLTSVVLIPAITIGLAGMSFSQATPATPATPASPSKKAEKMDTLDKGRKTKESHASGAVVSVDKGAGTLTVNADGKDLTITAETRAAKKALDKIKKGDSVRVNYFEKDGKLHARSIVETRS